MRILKSYMKKYFYNINRVLEWLLNKHKCLLKNKLNAHVKIYML